MTEHLLLTALLRATLSQARALRQRPDLCPELELYLLNQDFPRTPLSAQEQRAVSEQTAYWAFCWPAGQVLARWILDRPQTVEGLEIVDLGCGSGVAGLAAACAGAARVIACDRDQEALQAACANAELNGLTLETCCDWDPAEKVDVVLLADVLYDRANYPLLPWLQTRARTILAADSRCFELPEGLDPAGWTSLGRFSSSLVPDLDWNDEFRWVQLWRWECSKGTDRPIGKPHPCPTSIPLR